jgi:nucleoside-diphosphate kinase
MEKGSITFTMIKPKAIEFGKLMPILFDISQAGFKVVALKMTRLSKVQAAKFYEVHKDRPFYNDLVEFMSSGPVVAAVLEKDNAVEDYRKLIGNTNPAMAEDGTIRKKYALSIQENAVHGSDSDDNAIIESNFFFSQFEIYA